MAEVLTLRGFQVYPNPNMGSFTVELHLLQDTHVELTLVDALGHVVHTSSATAAAGQWKHAMALEGLSSGIYHLNVDLVGRRFSERIVVQ
ncbi:MAG: T9SS type A sorting domain-containing protein [Flavobacteriales bacterium]|nr:T9SS type A sorting domain-containing protein [Flavobacteriales bacterium]